MRKVNYDKFPSTKISGTILRGWNDIHTLLMECFKSRKVLAVELYAGVREDEVINELKSLSPTLLINTRDLMKPENEIKEMTERFMTKEISLPSMKLQTSAAEICVRVTLLKSTVKH